MSTLKIPIGVDDHVQGRPDVPISIVEYGDYECPGCGLAYPIVKAVQKHFGGNLRFVFRNFPLAQIHPNAETAAETAEWAGSEGRFWQMHDSLYENQGLLGLPLYCALAQGLGFSEAALAEALESRSFHPRVRQDFMGGVRSGVNGTPTFFINGRRHDGSYEFGHLVAAIDRAFGRNDTKN